MFLNPPALILGVVGLTLAQETGPNNTTAPAAIDGEITIHYVAVGKTENQFVPNSIVAKPGDIVQFQFYPQNHSVIQSLYGWPCIPKYDVVLNQPYFNSGFFPINSTEVPTWNLTINDTSPVFYYCGAPGSCIDWGMLGVINPDTQTSLVTQLTLAKSEAYMVEPGVSLPSAASVSLAAAATAAGASAAVTATVVLSTVSSTAVVSATSSASMPEQSKPVSLSTGAIAGIVVAGIVVLALGGVLSYCLGRNKSLRRALHRQQQGSQPEAGLVNPGSPPPMYQQFSRFPNEQEIKDLVTVQTSSVVNTDTLQSNQEPMLRPAHSQSRFSESSELCAVSPNVHEMYVPLGITVEETVDDRNGHSRTRPWSARVN